MLKQLHPEKASTSNFRHIWKGLKFQNHLKLLYLYTTQREKLQSIKYEKF